MNVAACNASIQHFGWLGRQLERPSVRSLTDFAIEEMRIPTGEYQDARFRFERQPIFRLLFSEMDSGRWSRYAITGTVQSGKSYCGFVIPMLYHLFELQEDVICGIPDLTLAADKWTRDILPAIEVTRYAEYLPLKGQGSRGGTSNLREIHFQNGARIRFMSGRGRDEKRSGFTARVVSMTEVDKIDTAMDSSRETSPDMQMEARASHWPAARRFISRECTVSIKGGAIWSEYTEGSQSKIICPCPHCKAWVTPEREHLKGWQETESAIAAGRVAHYVCPDCDAKITEDQRYQMNMGARLLHSGQEVTPEGEIVGRPRETRTLGFRWNAFNNWFLPTSDIGEGEWKANYYAETGDQRAEAAERERCQFVWVVPFEPPEVEATVITTETVTRAAVSMPRGVCPADTIAVTVGVDLGKWRGHYVILAWQSTGTPHVVDYGYWPIHSGNSTTRKATLDALREFRERLRPGFAGQDGTTRFPVQAWIDSGWYDNQEGVYDFAAESAISDGTELYRPAKGYGATQPRPSTYQAPTRRGGAVRALGEQYHITRVKPKVHLCHVNADYWKGRVHEQLAAVSNPTTIFSSPDGDHRTFANHLTAEEPQAKEVKGRGIVTVWAKKRNANHWLDAMALASAAGHAAGVRLTERHAVKEASTDDERGWFEKAKRK